jgi:two-component system OmpR family response regulator/two-component system response regulator TctD
MPKVLVVEDDMFVAAQVAEALREHDFLVDHGATGSDARAYLSVSTYDLIILDWELPDATGLDICQEFRAASHKPRSCFSLPEAV